MTQETTLEQIKRLREKSLTAVDGMTTIGVDEFQFLIKEAETLQKIYNETEDFYNEEIDLSDLGERVINII